MDDFALLVDLHKNSRRQGPGGHKEARKAIELAGLDPSTPLKIADIGCGTGDTTLLLAELLDAEITAIDLFPDFLRVLERNAGIKGLESRIETLQCSMDELPFTDETFDLLWSEGAIYIMGFEKGVNAWKRFLQPGGLLIVSEITWTGEQRPAEIQHYWQAQYPEIDTMGAKTEVLRRAGYDPVASFFLPESCWLDNYYEPLESSFADFLRRQGDSEDARAIIEAQKEEIALYRKYSSHYSYGMYIARKPA